MILLSLTKSNNMRTRGHSHSACLALVSLLFEREQNSRRALDGFHYQRRIGEEGKSPVLTSSNSLISGDSGLSTSRPEALNIPSGLGLCTSRTNSEIQDCIFNRNTTPGLLTMTVDDLCPNKTREIIDSS
ncbi:hypothetical protein RRG08_056817 [Elysia crispata]|uniref:Uncharacterized protein n=1 Tax=Elysia crispata TaxID=231223 RepID=A0AAE1DVR9_9GAST|nr:hypothetical protein RRG08_056817 [Elysia crispata]